MFEDFVRSGDLSADDLVYDGETGSWSPARTHPIVLEIQYELEDAEGGVEGEAAEEVTGADEDDEAVGRGVEERKASDGDEQQASTSEPGEGEGAAAEAGEAGPGAGGDAGLGLDLALTEELSPEDEQRRFVEQLEAERESDLDSGPSLRESLSGFTVDPDTMATDTGEAARNASPDLAPRPPRPERTRPLRPGPEPASGPAVPGRRGDERDSGLGRIVVAALFLAVLAGGGYLGYEMWSAGAQPPPAEDPGSDPGPTEPGPDPIDPDFQPAPSEPAPDTAEAEPLAEPVIPDTEAAVRERAQERYLAAIQAELRDLPSVPDIWPEGPYLTVPSDYPEVVDVWQAYLSTIRAVRSGDVERYRTAYEAALDDAAVIGEARAERLARGVQGFTEADSLRAAHFDRVEALATAALQSHNALIEAEGLMLYDATGSTGRTRGIGQGMSGRNGEAQLLLEQVLELLSAALEADGEGPGSAENVREWVWDGFLDAATR